MYDFLRRPAWIVSHVLIAALIVALIGLGFWQRSRWIDERDKKDALEERAELTPVAYSDLVDPAADTDSITQDVRFSRVVVAGEYDTAAEVAILNRSQGGAPGAWVLTPLVQADGTAVPVVRGWIPYDPAGETPPFEGAEPPQGEVTVTGNLQLTQERGTIGPLDAATGTLTSMARVDLDRLEQQLGYPLAPAWVLLDAQDPPQSTALPEAVELLTADPSQNFSYMMQWWIFALIAILGYPLVWRMVARSRTRGDQVAPPDEPDEERIDTELASTDPEPVGAEGTARRTPSSS